MNGDGQPRCPSPGNAPTHWPLTGVDQTLRASSGSLPAVVGSRDGWGLEAVPDPRPGPVVVSDPHSTITAAASSVPAGDFS